MIFKPVLVERVLAGDKVETRRPVRFNELGGVVACAYEPGRTYAVQPGRGKRQVARMLVESVHRERVGAVTDAAAVREGFEHAQAFRDYWAMLYGEWTPGTWVWVIRFRLTDAAPVQPALFAEVGHD